MDILPRVFEYILIMSLCACVIIPVVLLLRLVLKKAPKRINVLLWGIVALSLIVAPFIAKHLPSSTDTSSSLADQVRPENTISSTPVDNQKTPDSGIDPAPSNPVKITIREKIIHFVTNLQSHLIIPMAQHWTDIASFSQTFSVVWIICVVLMLSYLAVSYWHLHRKVATSVRLIENIYQSENVSFPFVLGIFKPRIYLPFKISVQDLEYVIAHEKAHIRHKDQWWKPLGFLLLTIHWFNPLMWVAYVLLCRDIELACDEKVIRKLGNEQKADYTQALVSCSVKRHTVTACPLAFGAVGVKDRVKAVMNYKKPTLWIKLLSFIVCIALSISALILTVLTTYSIPNGKLLFDPTSGTIVGYAGNPTKINIPTEIDGVPVVAIGPGALRFCESLTNITIPEGVEIIGAFAFAHCPNLRYIKLPDSLKSIGNLAFRLCESLTLITLPEGLESIGNEAFAYSGLTSITIPKNVMLIDSGAFSMCSSLKAIWVNEDNPNYSSDENGILFNKELTELHTYPAALEGSYTVPSGVTAIGSYAFSGSNLSQVNIPNTVTVLGTAAFYHCNNLTNITLPDGMVAINNSVFAKCSNLTDITFPVSITAIGNSVFSGCNSLTDIYFGGSARQWALMGNNSYSLSYGNTTIHYNAT